MAELIYIAPNGFYGSPAGVYDGEEALYEAYKKAFPQTPSTLKDFSAYICSGNGWKNTRIDNPGLYWSFAHKIP